MPFRFEHPRGMAEYLGDDDDTKRQAWFRIARVGTT